MPRRYTLTLSNLSCLHVDLSTKREVRSPIPNLAEFEDDSEKEDQDDDVNEWRTKITLMPEFTRHREDSEHSIEYEEDQEYYEERYDCS